MPVRQGAASVGGLFHFMGLGPAHHRINAISGPRIAHTIKITATAYQIPRFTDASPAASVRRLVSLDDAARQQRCRSRARQEMAPLASLRGIASAAVRSAAPGKRRRLPIAAPLTSARRPA